MTSHRRHCYSINPDTGVFFANDPPGNITDHVVFLNVNEKLPRIFEELKNGSNRPSPDIIVVVQDWALWERRPDWHPQGHHPSNIYYREGGVATTADLRMSRVEFAKVAVVLADPLQGRHADAHSTLTAVAIEKLNPHVHTVVELISSVNRVHLQFTQVNEVVCNGELTEKLIAQSCISPYIKKVFEHLLSTRPDTMQLFTVLLPRPFWGKSYRELVRATIDREAPFIVCGFSRLTSAATGNRTIVLNPRAFVEPGKDTRLDREDLLIIAAYRRSDIDRLLD